MFAVNPTEKRTNSRLSCPEYIIVKAKINEEDFWKEKANLNSVSRLGAGFDIQKPCKIGQLISLLIQMPVHLRLYDHDKQLYRIWGLVQHCHAVNNGEFTGYYVGVAFIGKDAPPSFYEKPDQSYRITGLNENGLWNITEARLEFIHRRHPRLWVSLSARLEFDKLLTEAKTENSELEADAADDFIKINCQTENISRSGAAVYCETTANVGDYVRFLCPEYDFKTEAIIRNRRGSGNTTPKIHLEFLENEFPVEKIELHFEG